MAHSSDRRHFLLSTLGAAAYATPAAGFLLNGCKSVNRPGMPDGTLLSDDAPVAVPSYINARKSATDLSNAKNIELYRKAVGAMKATPFPLQVDGEDTTWWAAHASIHNDSCPHGNWFFLPWHRGYLHHFEKVCREFCDDPSFALPFWDWTEFPNIPDAFASGDEKSNALFNPSRVLEDFVTEEMFLEKIKKGLLPPNTVDQLIACRQLNVQQLINAADFLTFAGGPSHNPRALTAKEASGYSGTLESGPHNKVHASMKGDMGTFKSPLDPLFWLHHCNVDRLWTIWAAARTAKNQDILPSATNDRNTDLTAKYWCDHKIGGYYSITKEGGVFKAAPSEMIVADVYDAIKMGLAYQPFVKIPTTNSPVQTPANSVLAPPVDSASPPVSSSVPTQAVPEAASPVPAATPTPAAPGAETPAPVNSVLQTPAASDATIVTPANAPVIPVPTTAKSLKSRWKSVSKVIKIKISHLGSFSLVTSAPAIIKIEGSADLNEAFLNGAMEWKGSHAVVLKLIVENIPFPTNPSGELLLYMNAANPTGEGSNPSFIASVNFFGHRHAGSTMSAAFDLVPTVKKLTAARKLPFDSSGAKPIPVVITAIWKNNSGNDDLSQLAISLDYVKTVPSI